MPSSMYSLIAKLSNNQPKCVIENITEKNVGLLKGIAKDISIESLEIRFTFLTYSSKLLLELFKILAE